MTKSNIPVADPTINFYGVTTREGTLFKRTIHSLFWVFVSHGGGRFLGVIRSVVLARLLLPHDFGIIGLAEVATGFLSILVEMGVSQALIQKQNITDEVLDTAWVISIIRGLILSAASFLVAGTISVFYDTPELAIVLRFMAILFLISGFNSTGLILLQKQMDFRKLTYFDFISMFLGLVGTIFLALIFRNFWALVFGSFIQATVFLIGSFLVHPYRPKLRFHKQVAKEILDFGKYIFAGGIVNYFLTQGDNAFVGKLLGASQLGLYRMAYTISNMPSTSITSVIGQVSYPVYAHLQNDTIALREAYLKFYKMTCMLVIPLSVGMMILAPEIVKVVFGEKWMPMVPSFIILCVYGLERGVNASVPPLLKAKGKPQIPFLITLVKLFLLAVVIYPLTVQYGIVGTSIASSLVAILVSISVFSPASRALDCKVTSLLMPILGPAVSTVIMAVCLLLLKLTGFFKVDFVALIILIPIGFVIYGIGLLLFDRQTVWEVRQGIISLSRSR
jgi:lipopolysaccharide exporter